MASPRRLALIVIAGVLLALSASACSAPAQGQGPGRQPAELPLTAASMSLEPYIEALRDPDGQLTIDQVTDPALADRFALASSSTRLNDLTGRPAWVRFTVRNPSDRAADYYVQVATATPTAVDFYAPDPGSGIYSLLPPGASRPGMLLPLPSSSFVYPVTVPARGEVTYYLRPERANAGVRMPLELWRPLAFERTDKIQSAVWGALVGSLLMTAALSLFLFIGLRERNFLLLAAFAAAYALLTLASGSGSMQPIWPGSATDLRQQGHRHFDWEACRPRPALLRRGAAGDACLCRGN
ncbi:MAG: 7TM-DISM domain-containing protein [Anaerolineae bacterium]